MKRFLSLVSVVVLLMVSMPPTASASLFWSQQVDGSAQFEVAAFGMGYAGCGGEDVAVVNGGFEQQVVEMVNKIRASQATPLPPLKRMAALDAAARYHAADLGQENYFAHDSFDRIEGNLTKSCPWYDRLGAYYNGAYKGENVAGGFATPQDAINGWMNSAPHRANLLSADYSEIGVGYWEGSGTYYRYYVQDFGQRGDVFPLVVNGDAASTDSRTVQLYVYGNWQEMRIGNDGGVWGEWQPFRNTTAWTLEGGVGYRTVFVEMRSGTTTASSSDWIYLTAATP